MVVQFFITFLISEKMMDIKPFRALRPKKNKAPLVACPPYDVVSTEDAQNIIAKNPSSFLKILRPEAINNSFDQNVNSEKKYQIAKKMLMSFEKDGSFKRDEDPSIYLYRQVMNGRSQTGIVACVSTDDYKKNLIKKHEQTRKKKEDDRTLHTLTLKANAGPVFLTYKNNTEINSLIDLDVSERSIFHFVDENNITHTGWKVLNPDEYVKAFKQVDSLYIADGHHRAASASRASSILEKENTDNSKKFNWFMSVIFPASDLQIFPYNRIITGIGDISETLILDALKKIGEISSRNETKINRGNTCIFYKNRWLNIKLKKGSKKTKSASSHLEVSKIQDLFLRPTFQINDPRNDPRLKFIGGIHSEAIIESEINNDSSKIGIAFPPTSIEDLFSIADAGEEMPPKSTWFEPKLKSGLFIHLLDGNGIC